MPASIHPSLHLLTRSKEAFVSLKIKETPQIMIFSQGGGKDPLGQSLVLTSPKLGHTYQGRGSVGMSVRKDEERRAAEKSLSRPF